MGEAVDRRRALAKRCAPPRAHQDKLALCDAAAGGRHPWGCGGEEEGEKEGERAWVGEGGGSRGDEEGGWGRGCGERGRQGGQGGGRGSRKCVALTRREGEGEKEAAREGEGSEGGREGG